MEIFLLLELFCFFSAYLFVFSLLFCPDVQLMVFLRLITSVNRLLISFSARLLASMIAAAVIVGGDCMDFFLSWPGLIIVLFVCLLGVLLDDDGCTSMISFIYLLFYVSLFCIYHILGGDF